MLVKSNTFLGLPFSILILSQVMLHAMPFPAVPTATLHQGAPIQTFPLVAELPLQALLVIDTFDQVRMS